MKWFLGRKWYLATIALLLSSLCSEGWAKRLIGQVVVATAQSREPMQVFDDSSAALQEAEVLTIVGMVLTALSCACWLVSRKFKDPGPQGVLLVFMVLNMMVFLLQI